MKIRLRNVQALRAFAALMVVLNHLPDLEVKVLGRPGLLAGFGAAGAAGVDLFFVISGFIMMVTMWDGFGKKGAPGDFLRRRVLRIFPIYYIAIALFAVDRFFEHRPLRFDPQGLFATLTLFPTGTVAYGVAWSLQFEMVFYYIFTIALIFDRKRLPLVMTVWILGTLILNAVASQSAVAFLGDPLTLEFIGGMLVGVLCIRAHFFFSRPAALIGFALFLLASWSFAPYQGLNTPPLEWHRALTAGAASLLLLYGAVGSEHVFKLVAPKPLVDLGDASYSLYLMHGYLIGIVADVFLKFHRSSTLVDVAFLVVAYVAVAIGATAIYTFVERPIMLAIRKHTAAKPMSHGVEESIAPAVA